MSLNDNLLMKFKSIITYFKIAFFTSLLFLSTTEAFTAETLGFTRKVSESNNDRIYTATGVVLDSDKQPIIGATVHVVDSKNYTTTNEDGKFTLEGVAENQIIRISFIGMKTEEIKYKGQKNISVILEDDAVVMDAVRVVAKANINEIDLRSKSGVVQSVDMARVADKPILDMGLALQGSVPGLSVINTGELGSAPKIRIRGNSSFRKGNKSNEPLYVLDGQIISPDTFYNLNPVDIDDIKVLKDAAACALYGIKAANGVLEISSKRGHKGSTRVTYNMNVGVTTRGRRGVKLMKTDEKLEFERRMENEQAPGYRYSEDYYRHYYANDPKLDEMIAEGKSILNELRKVDTDWFNELLRISAYQRHNLSVRGGTQETSYYLSANYSHQGGRIPGNKRDRMGMRLNLDQKLGNLGYLLVSVNGGYGKTMTPNGTSNDPASLVYQLNPYETKKSKLYSYPNYTFDDLMNQFKSETEIKDAGLSMSVNITPLEGLDLMSVTGLDFSVDEGYRFVPSTAYDEVHSGVPMIARGVYSKKKNTSLNISNNIRLSYNKVFNEKHDLTLGANMDYYLYKFDGVFMKGFGVGEINSASAINQSLTGNRQPKVGGPKDKNAQLGIGVVSGYSYNSIYDLYATFKADASSILPSDKRWNYAWGVGGGITISNYPFLKDSKVITMLSLKGSYGWMANLSGVSPSSTVGTFAYSLDSYEDVRPLYMINLYNKDLKAEQTKSTDFSITAGFFNRVTLDLNLYNRIIDDALLDMPIPSSTGYTSLLQNVGSLRNRGIEFRLQGTVFETENSRFTVGASLAYNDNKVMNLYDQDQIFTTPDALIPEYEVGQPYDVMYGSEVICIDPFTGYPILRLPNGDRKNSWDEKLKREDISSLGHTTPPYNGSINLNYTYGSFDFNMDFYYVLGGVQTMSRSYIRDKDHSYRNAAAGQLEKQWFNKGDVDKEYWNPYYTKPTAEENLTLYPSSLTVADSDYLRLSMLSIRYRFSQKFLNKFAPFIRYANFGFQGSNLFTLTPYKESNPEGGTMAGAIQPVFTFTMNLTF